MKAIFQKPQKERNLHKTITDYVKYQYPDVIFITDASGNYMPGKNRGAIFSALKSDSGIPDLLILEPRGKFHGLLLEIKGEGARLYLRDGSLSKDKHIQKQHLVICRLKGKGYAAMFVQGFDQAKFVIDKYMALEMATRSSLKRLDDLFSLPGS